MMHSAFFHFISKSSFEVYYLFASIWGLLSCLTLNLGNCECNGQRYGSMGTQLAISVTGGCAIDVSAFSQITQRVSRSPTQTLGRVHVVLCNSQVPLPLLAMHKKNHKDVHPGQRKQVAVQNYGDMCPILHSYCTKFQ